MMFKRSALFAGLLLAASAAAQAQIFIGQTAGFSGPVAAGVAETTQGAKLYFDAVNAKGGIHGQKIELVSLDDKFDAATAAKNAQTLASDPKFIALFLSRGTPQTQAILPVLEQHKIALVAPSTGAMQLHKPVLPYVFNVRASYQREARRAVEHLKAIGVTRIVVLHPDDSFGQDALAGATEGFQVAGIKPLLQAKFDQKRPEFMEAVTAMSPLDVQAVIFIGSAQAVSWGTKLMRGKGINAQIVTLSNNASRGFIETMGEQARGVIITQVFPYERSIAKRLVKEALQLAKAQGQKTVSPAMLEGFAGAKVLAEGLRRAGRNPDRADLIRSLNAISALDIGGMTLSYSPSDHSGLDFVDVSIIDWKGTLLR